MNASTMTSEQIARHAKRLADSKRYAAIKFRIPENEISDYNSGICYSKIWVTTKAAADKVAASVKGETVNGGMFHDMPLGGISFDGTVYEVMC